MAGKKKLGNKYCAVGKTSLKMDGNPFGKVRGALTSNGERAKKITITIKIMLLVFLSDFSTLRVHWWNAGRGYSGTAK